MPPTVWEAVTLWPAIREAPSATVQVPFAPTNVAPAALELIKRATLAPATPRPPMVVLPSTSGVLMVGAGGRATTTTSAENALEIPPTVCRALTCWPATSGLPRASVHVLLPLAIAVPTETPSTKASTVAPGEPVPVRLDAPSTRGLTIDGGAGRATTVTAADGIEVTPASVWVAVTC